jgi:hypothetical protein
MKRLLLLGLVSLFVCGTAVADVPDPDLSGTGWDTMGDGTTAFMSPSAATTGLGSVSDDVLITVLNNVGIGIGGAAVEIDVADCVDLCLDPGGDGSAGLTGVTDPDGTVTLNPRVGGCETCTILVRASGVTIATYSEVHSTDWNSAAGPADGTVGGPDFAFFAAAFNVTQDDCADYDNNETVGGPDLAVFAASFNLDAGTQGACQP